MKTLTTIAIVAACATAQAKPFRESAKSHIDKATKAHKAGKFDIALTELQAAYEIDPQPKLLFAMAQVEAKLGNCDDAIDHYNQFLTSTKDKAKQAVVKQAIAACVPAPVEGPPPVDVVAPTPAEPAPPPPPPPPPVVEAPKPAPIVVAPPPPVATITTKRPFYRDVLGDVLVIGGAAAGVVSFVEYRGAVNDLDDAESAPSLTAYNDLVAQAHDKRNLSLAIAGGSAVLLITGVVRFAMHGGGETRAAVAVVPTSTGGLITWSGGF
jgi:tetratricopeptide (TPR) repeat protein